MLIQKNVRTSFLLNAGRRRSSANGWSAAYQLLDKSGAVIFPAGGGYSTQDLQEIGNGLYGVAITFGTTYCGFVRWKITKGVSALYTVEPFTVLSSFGNKGVEQTYIANYGKSRTGKSVEFRILNDDLTEERTWSNTGLIELGFGIYAAAVRIDTVMTGYIHWRNNTDGLYLTDPILVFDSLNAPIIQTGSLAVSVDNANIEMTVNTTDIGVTVNQNNIALTVDDPDVGLVINSDMGITVS